ncbi:hypothetical protein ACLK1T_02240 [Escherichia coli]
MPALASSAPGWRQFAVAHNDFLITIALKAFYDNNDILSIIAYQSDNAFEIKGSQSEK